MENSAQQENKITVQTTVNAPMDKVWEYFTSPEHIVKWNHANDEWHSPHAENDLRPGGNFSYRMEAKDGSMGFDFGGVYDEVKERELVSYSMSDGRKVKITFRDNGDTTEVAETFDAEETNPVDMQRAGWQAILDNFKKHVES